MADRATMEHAARAVAELGPKHVLIKGGHATGPALDLLWSGGEFHEFTAERIDSTNTHGTGCVLSAAIVARLARGEPIIDAIRGAKRFVTQAIRTAPSLGGGVGPTNMLADFA